jgi:hypothetical protein
MLCVACESRPPCHVTAVGTSLLAVALIVSVQWLLSRQRKRLPTGGLLLQSISIRASG